MCHIRGDLVGCCHCTHMVHVHTQGTRVLACGTLPYCGSRWKTLESHLCDSLPCGHTAETILPGAGTFKWWALGASSRSRALWATKG